MGRLLPSETLSLFLAYIPDKTGAKMRVLYTFLLKEPICNQTVSVTNMSRRRKVDDVDWSALENAREHKRVLLLKKDDKEIYHCPVESCSHPVFTCKRGYRIHINNIRPWYFYFDENPTGDMNNQMTSTSSNQRFGKENVHYLHAFLSCELRSE